MSDTINRPHHYTHMPGPECIEIAEHLSFCAGNAVKYIYRAGVKDPAKHVEDLKKAAWYVNREIARVEALRASRVSRSMSDECDVSIVPVTPTLRSRQVFEAAPDAVRTYETEEGMFKKF